MKKILSAFLCLAVIFSCSYSVSKTTADAASTPTTIIACSDFQIPSKDNAEGQQIIINIINAMKKDGITSADGFFCGGDYSQYYNDTMITKSGVAFVKDAVKDVVTNEENMIFVQGNHDSSYKNPDSGLSNAGVNDPSNGAYSAYVIHEDDYMWYNDNEETIKQAAADLKVYLDEKVSINYQKPVFVLTHIPIHWSKDTPAHGDGLHGRYIFDVVNEAAAKGLNIIFMYGHVHGDGCCEDARGGSAIYSEPGETIRIANHSATDTTVETLNFTYMNYGYVGYYAAQKSGCTTDLSMTVFKIYDDRVVISRYSKDGRMYLSGVGVDACEHELPYAATGTIDSPHIKALKSNISAFTYKVTGGANGTWTSDSTQGLSVSTDGDCLLLTGIKIDGNAVDSANYTITPNPTTVTITADYLKTLSDGKHKFCFIFADGECSTEFTKTNAAIGNTSSSAASSSKPTGATNTSSKAPTTSSVSSGTVSNASSVNSTSSIDTDTQTSSEADNITNTVDTKYDLDDIFAVDEQDNSLFTVLWIMLGCIGAAAVAGITVCVIVIIKKKSKEKTEN